MVVPRRFGAALLMLHTSAAFAEAPAIDLFTGTVSIDQGRPVLNRCDAVGNRYTLIDERADATHALPEYARSGSDVFDVVGSADETGGASTLTVREITKRVPRPLCHIAEIDAMVASAPVQKTNTDEPFDLAALLECRSDPATADRFGHWLESNAETLATASLTRVPSHDFLAEFRAAKPFRVFGHMTTTLARHPDGFMAVLKDITPQALAQQIGATTMLSGEPFIAQKLLDTPPANEAARQHVPVIRMQIVTSRPDLPGKAIAGCLYISTEDRGL